MQNNVVNSKGSRFIVNHVLTTPEPRQVIIIVNYCCICSRLVSLNLENFSRSN